MPPRDHAIHVTLTLSPTLTRHHPYLRIAYPSLQGTVLTRCLHRHASPATVNDRSGRGTLVWAGLTSAVMLVADDALQP